MKKLLLVLGLSLLAFSIQVSAASKDLGLIDDNDMLGDQLVKGDFTYNYTFTVPDMARASISVTNPFVDQVGKIANFTATLDDVSLDLTSGPSSQTLGKLFDNLAASTVHTLIVSGSSRTDGTSSFGGSIQVAIGSTPIPAAIWLFGSALAGLTGLKRRQACA